MAPLLQVKELRTSFFTSDGEVRAVDGVTFDIDDGRTGGREPSPDVVKIPLGRRRAAEDQELIAGQPGDGDVGLVPAAGIQHAGIDGSARRYVYVGRAKPLQGCERFGTRHQVLGERGLVEHGDTLAGRALLGRRPR